MKVTGVPSAGRLWEWMIRLKTARATAFGYAPDNAQEWIGQMEEALRFDVLYDNPLPIEILLGLSWTRDPTHWSCRRSGVINLKSFNGQDEYSWSSTVTV